MFWRHNIVSAVIISLTIGLTIMIRVTNVLPYSFINPNAPIRSCITHNKNPLFRLHTHFSYCRNSYLNRVCMAATNSQSTSNRRMGELTKSEQMVYDVLVECSKSNYPFRIVVVGKNNTAILESTVPCLGPQIKILQSPSTGANMVTLCNDDQSFEYHVQLEQVHKISFLTKESPKNKNILRILRFVNESNESLTSFILRNDSDDAVSWFESLIQRYGSEVQVVQ